VLSKDSQFSVSSAERARDRKDSRKPRNELENPSKSESRRTPPTPAPPPLNINFISLSCRERRQSRLVKPKLSQYLALTVASSPARTRTIWVRVLLLPPPLENAIANLLDTFWCAAKAVRSALDSPRSEYSYFHPPITSTDTTRGPPDANGHTAAKIDFHCGSYVLFSFSPCLALADLFPRSLRRCPAIFTLRVNESSSTSLRNHAASCAKAIAAEAASDCLSNHGFELREAGETEASFRLSLVTLLDTDTRLSTGPPSVGVGDLSTWTSGADGRRQAGTFPASLILVIVLTFS
jgi:hypothetical protein